MDKPRFKRREMLALVPGVSADMFGNWVRRGQFSRMGVDLYSGNDVIALMVLDLFSRLSIPLTLTKLSTPMVQGYVERRMRGDNDVRKVLIVDIGGRKATVVRPDRIRNEFYFRHAEAYVVLDLDPMVTRFFAEVLQ